jgi:hypothetical protein
MKKDEQIDGETGIVRDEKFNTVIPQFPSSDSPPNTPVSPADLGRPTRPTQTEDIQSTWRVSGQIHSH